MKRITLVILLLLAPTLFADAGQHLIPAGSLVSCNTGAGKISSKTTAMGDPVLCKVQHRRGDFMLPYGAYLGGEFSEFRDPGHLVGKGFMKLDFDRLYIGDSVVPVNAKVVDVPGYGIDAEGRVLGKGHPVRDTISWLIPILWPIDLINLPRRGPRPTLKAETALTLRVMEDVKVPETSEPERDPYGLIPRRSQSYAPAPQAPVQQQQPVQQMSYAPQPYAQPVQQPVQQAVIQPMMMPYPVVVAQPYIVAPPPMYAYGGILIEPQVVAYGYAPPVYVPQAYYGVQYPAPAYGIRYGYPTAPAAYGAGYAARGPAMVARAGLYLR
jgi:hypothetical protein